MSKVITQFEGDTPEKTKAVFLKYLGEQSEWFAEVLYDIKERWIDNESKITDILIRENMPIYLAVIKAHVRYQPKVKMSESGTSSNWSPSRSDMTAVLEKFYSLSDYEKKGRKDGDYEGLSLDFSFSVDGLGIFRVNFSQEINGCVMSIRVLSYELPSFGMIGYPSFYVDMIKAMITKVYITTASLKREAEGEKTEMIVLRVGNVENGGLILHVGPTGSGKTTAIAAEINFIAENTTGGILTYENPIEYRYISTKAPVRQYELGKNLIAADGESEFKAIPGHLLRSNPAVVMIGEARNKDEMKMLLDIASRGHLVFATIHATNVMEAISLLFGAAGEDRHLIANALKAIVAHKLVRSKDGKIYGLHEILIIDQTIKSFLMKENTKDALDGIKRVVYQETNNDGMKDKKITFADSLFDMERVGKIDFSTRKQIEDSNYGLFVEQPNK